MRPLAVLVLVAGAITALVFAFFRIQDSGNTGGGTNIAQPASPAGVVEAAETDTVALIPSAGLSDPSGLNEGGEREAAPMLSADEQASWSNALEGVVLDPEGNLVAGAKVELLKDAGSADVGAMMMLIAGESRSKALRTMETKENGAFRFGRLAPGNHWSLRVSHPSFQEQQIGPIDLPEEGSVQESIQLDDGFVLYGRVVAAGTKQPIEGATLSLENPAAAFLPNMRNSIKPDEAVSDANGYYELRNVTPNGKLLACMAKGFATQVNQRDTSIVGATEMRKQIDFELEEGMTIAGRVLAPDGSGVEGLRIDALGSNAKSSSRGVGVSGKGGEFLVSDIAEGRYSLRIDRKGLERLTFYTDPIQASAGDQNVEIHLQAQGGLMGVVTGDDGPVSRFRVTVRQQHPTNRAFGHIVKKQDFRSDKGEFRVEGINQGNYVVQVEASGYTASFSDPVAVQQGETVPDVEIHMTTGGVIVGQVIDTYTNKPIAGARVTTLDNNHISSEFTDLLVRMAPTGLTKAEGVTDSEGRFELPLILPDSYQVRIEKRGYTGYTTNDVFVVEGQDIDLGSIALSKGGTVRGTVFLADGQPGPGVEISIAPLTPALGTGMRTRADAQGNFVLQNIPAGSFKLSGSRPAKATESPFTKIVDMRNSEIEVNVVDGQEVTFDLYLGGN